MRLRSDYMPSPNERCNSSRYSGGFYHAPASVLEKDQQHRLAATLRTTVQRSLGDPSALLATATRASLVATNAAGRASAQALADLAVSGATNFAAFCRRPPRDAQLVPLVEAQLPAQPRITRANVERAVRDVLDRAYRIAWTLCGYLPREDASLGWIGVSGEDDPPHRPVNIPGPSFNNRPLYQYTVSVPVRATASSRAKTVTTRYIVSSLAMPAPPTTPARAIRDRVPPPTNLRPTIPANARILLYIHGHSSRLEECLDMLPALMLAGFTVISMDLPNNGFSSRFAHTDIAASPKPGLANATTGPYAALDFIEQFVVDFVRTLGIGNQLEAVIGGSLGGNMGLRLAQRDPATHPWLRNVVSWSPASTWGESWARAVHGAGGGQTWPDAAKFEAVRTTRDRTNAAESPASRRDYFRDVFMSEGGRWFDRAGAIALLGAPIVAALEALGAESQPTFWWRDSWQPCKDILTDGALFERRELYHPHFRQWHWRVAHEQLTYMHLEPRDEPLPRYKKIRSRVLLCAGEEDNDTPVRLYDNTRLMGVRMINTPGATMWLRRTGHSVHNERPLHLGLAINNFLPPPRPRPRYRVERWNNWTSLTGAGLLAGSLAAAQDAEGNILVAGIDARTRQPRLRAQGSSGRWAPLGDSSSLPASVPFTGPLALSPLEDGRLRVYAIRSDHNWLGHFTQTDNGRNFPATDLGNRLRQLIGDIASVAVEERVGTGFDNKPMRLHLVVARLRDGRIMVRGQNSTGYPNAYWNQSITLSDQRFVGVPATVRDQQGLIHLFARDASGAVFHIRETAPDKWPRTWTRMGRIVTSGDLCAGRTMDGIIEVFAVSRAGQLQTTKQFGRDGAFRAWELMTGPAANASRPAVALDGWGRTQLFVRTTSNQIAYRSHEPNGTWSAWTTIAGAVTSDPIVVPGRNGMLSVFALRAGGVPGYTSQTSVAV